MKPAAGVIVVTVVLTVAVVLSGALGSNDTEAPDETVGVTPTIAAVFTQPPLPARPPPIPPTPTVEPGRARLEPTLVEAATGRTVPLWEPGNEAHIQPPSFSADGRHMVFARFQNGVSTIHHVDLRDPMPEVRDLGKGFFPTISPNGRYVALLAGDSAQSKAEIWALDGVRVASIPGAGFGASWSPDGRWLAQVGAYEREGEPIPVFLIDARTWQSSVVGHFSCQCDAVKPPQWASNSLLFFYSYPVEGSGIVSLAGLPVKDLPRPIAWHPDGVRYAWSSYESAAPSNNAGLYDLRDGRSTRLVETGIVGEAVWSPTGNRLALLVGGTGTLTLDIIDASGPRIATIEGFDEPKWSPDGAYLWVTTVGLCGKAPAAYSVGQAGVTRNCLASNAGASRASWSPVESLLVFTKFRRLDPSDRSSAPAISHDVYLLDPGDGSERLLVQDVRGDMGCLTWSPDGRFVMFHSCGGI
jgi:Tol biopolymer transport system component